MDLSLTFWRRVVPRVLQTIAWFPTRLALALFGRFDIRGREHLAGLSHAIFAVNHSNEIDPILLTAAVGPFSPLAPMFFIMIPRTEVRQLYTRWYERLYQTAFFHAWGSYALVRGLRDYAEALRTHAAILAQGGSLCVFPEGSITKTGELREFKGGIVHLSRETGVPIVPVAISGSYRLTTRDLLSRKRRLVLEFGAPIAAQAFEGASPERYRAEAARIHAVVARMLARRTIPEK